MAKTVNGVYDADPKKHDNAQKFDRLTYIDLINKELAVMDTTATSLCMDNRIPLVVFNLNEEGNIMRAVLGESVGTYIGGKMCIRDRPGGISKIAMAKLIYPLRPGV